MPNTIAFVSIAKIPISACRPFRNRKPSRIERKLGRSTSSSGGSFGSHQIASSDATYVAASIPNVHGTPAVAMITPPIAGPATLESEL